jgi:hypothetical protein
MSRFSDPVVRCGESSSERPFRFSAGAADAQGLDEAPGSFASDDDAATTPDVFARIASGLSLDGSRGGNGDCCCATCAGGACAHATCHSDDQPCSFDDDPFIQTCSPGYCASMRSTCSTLGAACVDSSPC